MKASTTISEKRIPRPKIMIFINFANSFILCIFCKEYFVKVCKDTLFFGACRIISYFCPFFVEKYPRI